MGTFSRPRIRGQALAGVVKTETWQNLYQQGGLWNGPQGRGAADAVDAYLYHSEQVPGGYRVRMTVAAARYLVATTIPDLVARLEAWTADPEQQDKPRVRRWIAAQRALQGRLEAALAAPVAQLAEAA